MPDLSKITHALIGITEEIANEPYDGPLELEEIRMVVALFTSQQKAEEYVEKSKLSTFQELSTWRDSGRQFRASSLLVNCSDYRIESWEGLPPVDPKPPSKKGKK